MNADDIATVLSTVDMFAGLSPKVLKRLAESGRVVESPPEAEIVHAGEPVWGFRAFSPEASRCTCPHGHRHVRVNGQVVRTLIADDYFGELALIDGSPDRPTSWPVIRVDDLGHAEVGFETVKEHPRCCCPSCGSGSLACAAPGSCQLTLRRAACAA